MKKNHFKCYVGHLPKDVFEDTLVPLFEEYGKIYDLRIMMDSLTGMSRGYAFVTFMDAESCKKASEEVCCGFCEEKFRRTILLFCALGFG